MIAYTLRETRERPTPSHYFGWHLAAVLSAQGAPRTGRQDVALLASQGGPCRQGEGDLPRGGQGRLWPSECGGARRVAADHAGGSLHDAQARGQVGGVRCARAAHGHSGRSLPLLFELRAHTPPPLAVAVPTVAGTWQTHCAAATRTAMRRGTWRSSRASIVCASRRRR